MPTQEERLNTLEYDLKPYKTETIKDYGAMAIEMTIVKGLTEDAVKWLTSLKVQIERVDTHLDAMDAHLTRLDRVENLLAQIFARRPETPGNTSLSKQLFLQGNRKPPHSWDSIRHELRNEILMGE